MHENIPKKDFYSLVVFGIFTILFSFYVYNFINTKNHIITGTTPIVIILSPHFDDAVLSLGGMLNKSNTNTIVVTFLAEIPDHHGKTKWDKISGFSDEETAVKDRIIENKHALSMLGVRQKNLSFLDYQYRDHTTANSQLLTKQFEGEIEKLLLNNKGRAIFMYGPSLFGDRLTHPDHLLLHNAFKNVIARHISDPQNHFYFYEDFPYVFGYEHSFSDSLIKLLTTDTKFKLIPVEISLTKTDSLLKNAALRQYPSQIKAFGSMSFDVIKESSRFMANRCAKDKLPYCEVVYKILK